MNNTIVDTEVHLIHPEAREPDFKKDSEEPVRRAIHEHEDFPLLEDLMIVDALIESMQKNNIDKAIIMGLSWLDPEVQKDNNRFIRETIENHPERFRGMFIPNLNDPQRAARTIEEIDTELFRGVKLIPGWQNIHVNDPSLRPVVEVTKKRDLFFMVHTDHPTQSLDADTPYRLLNFLKEHPDLNVLAPHLGGLLCLYAVLDEIQSAVSNTHFITSVSATINFVQYAADVNPDNLLFGTDFPFNHCHDQSTVIDEIDKLELDESVRTDILGRTAWELFDCDEW